MNVPDVVLSVVGLISGDGETLEGVILVRVVTLSEARSL